ncbi:MAG TPA: TIGR04197 family type VII secretion effector [Pseudogracilibacillus sp.]|nr:TIGR04197 family type VII secretion effector [Pseudogracilibacillus sp.]
MAGKVSLNLKDFDANTEKLKSAVSNINSSFKLDYSLETNIKPFTKDLETTIDAIKLLEQYKQMLNADAWALDFVGQEMVQQDQDLSNVIQTSI